MQDRLVKPLDLLLSLVLGASLGLFVNIKYVFLAFNKDNFDQTFGHAADDVDGIVGFIHGFDFSPNLAVALVWSVIGISVYIAFQFIFIHGLNIFSAVKDYFTEHRASNFSVFGYVKYWFSKVVLPWLYVIAFVVWVYVSLLLIQYSRSLSQLALNESYTGLDLLANILLSLGLMTLLIFGFNIVLKLRYLTK